MYNLQTASPIFMIFNLLDLSPIRIAEKLLEYQELFIAKIIYREKEKNLTIKISEHFLERERKKLERKARRK